ncbi:hypothetical protein RHD99_13910 [Buttiauxella selenatireducens]|uniref:Uncharacterized protein n=1 Tax=Buttiauxella selenatireducens TaxID=3073902 RepID=A0ABY9S6B8_9ENTR|nr:hypothetical protein [Buttiauxella sp. R73]WMY72575.1 hypothetical protein RHD99_13910 [Buttiauxella sp. R73]
MSRRVVMVLIAALFLALSLISRFLSLMIAGLSVSGSGCGAQCSANMEFFQNAGLVFLVLALVMAVIAIISPGKNKKVNHND